MPSNVPMTRRRRAYRQGRIAQRDGIAFNPYDNAVLRAVFEKGRDHQKNHPELIRQPPLGPEDRFDARKPDPQRIFNGRAMRPPARKRPPAAVPDNAPDYIKQAAAAAAAKNRPTQTEWQAREKKRPQPGKFQHHRGRRSW